MFYRDSRALSTLVTASSTLTLARRTPVNLVSNTALTPLSFLERSSPVFPGKLAVVYGDRTLTYRQLAEEATRVAHALRASGIQPGDRVAYLMANLPEMLVAQFAVPLAGGVLVSVNTRLSDEEIAYILNHCGAKVLVTDSAFLPAVAETSDPRAVALVGSRLVGYDDFTLRESSDLLEWEVEDELAPISINYTSGPTGKPQGVVYTHRGAYLNCFGEMVHSCFNTDSVYLWTLPMFHANGWCTPWAGTAVGGTHGCLREVRGDAIWHLIREHRVTHLNGAPTVVTTIMNEPQP